MLGPTFLRFINAVHRRYVMWRLLERTALGLLAGSMAGLGLLPLVVWADLPAFAFVSGTLGFGAGIGLLFGILRRPTRLDSAMEADRQLDLKDLLGTALSLCPPERDPWAAAVMAIANARCEQLRPGSVLLNRISARAWGGIGLSAAGALALALFFGSPSDSRAAATRLEASVPASNPAALPIDMNDRPLIAVAPAAPGAAAEHDDPESHSVGQSTPSQKTVANQPPTATDPDSARANGSSSPGTGGGSSQTNKPPTTPTPTHSQDSSPSVEHGAAGTAKASGSTGGLGASEASQTKGTANRSGAVSNGAHIADAHRTPPWNTDAWPSDVQRAHELLDAGQVPPAYQEMVRRYFER